MNEQISILFQPILDSDMPGTKEAVQAALDAGLEPGQNLADGMITAMKEVGRLFEEGDYFVPEMLVAARSMQGELAMLMPYLMKSEIKGDVQNIGKNLVALSALLIITIPSMKITIDATRQAGLRDRVKIIVAKAPATQDYSDQIDTDGYSPDDRRAIGLVHSLIQEG